MDNDKNNIYDVQIKATDTKGNTSLLQFNIKVVDKSTPIINGPNNISIRKPNKIIYKFTSNEEVQWSINGGRNKLDFQINNEGILSFKNLESIENFQNIEKFNSNINFYNIIIKATDNNNNSTDHEVNISLLNKNDPIIIGPTNKLQIWY